MVSGPPGYPGAAEVGVIVLILCLNRGSSTLRYAAYRSAAARLEQKQTGTLEIAPYEPGASGNGKHGHEAVQLLFDSLARDKLHAPDIIMHRLVRGTHSHDTPAWLSAEYLDELRQATNLAPLHLPPALEIIDACRIHFGDTAQAASFDTAFHASLPAVARRIALPRNVLAGAERCGFHGLSCEYVASVLKNPGRTVIAHLGSGASMTAVNQGQVFDTSMGFTPTGGLMMSTRSGDLDPGVLVYLLQSRRISLNELETILNLESGLLGVSEHSADMQTLLNLSEQQPDARDAVELFCYLARKHLAAMIAVLGGIDTLVFTGGIGENAPFVRQLICHNLGHLGIRIDSMRNVAGAGVISPRRARCTIRVVHTNEELIMARHARELLKQESIT